MPVSKTLPIEADALGVPLTNSTYRGRELKTHNGMVESRYAEALLCATDTPENADAVETALVDFSALFSVNTELKVFLLNPLIPRDIKKNAIKEIIADVKIPIFLNFLCLLTDKSRIEFVGAIYTEYRKIKNARRKKIDIFVYSAQILEEEQLFAICEKYKNKFGAEDAEVFNIEDPALLGGICVKIGDTFIDDTLFGRLKELEAAFEIS